MARGEWLTVQSALITGNTNVNDPNAQGEETAIIPASELNSMGFYPPALALVVRGTSRVHASPSARLTRGGAGGMAMADGNGKNNVAKAEDNVIGDLANNLVEGKNKEGKALRGMAMSVSKDLKEDKLDLDPKKIWKEALAKADVRRSGVIVDTAGTLGVMNKFNHVVELLKESLRRGITVEPWAHEALAQAMEASQASDIDLERALTSAIDLDPKNAQAYIKASKAIAKTNPEQAIKLCVVAAKLEPELADPYMNAMAFAGDTKGKMNIDQLSWAANNVLNRDWASDTAEYHSEARAKLNDMIAQLTTQGRHEEAKKIQIMMDGDKRRDLVIQLIWTNGGERETAGLDLKVNEPAGSVCSVLNSQTASGGVLISDFYKKNDGGHVETYTASEAFSGEYSISVDKVWGRPLGNKATIKVTRNQGMPNEKIEMHTIDLSKPEVVKLSVQDGRRTKVASVPPPNFNAVKSSKPSREDLAVKKLEAIVEPVNAMEGGITSTAKPTAATKVKPAVDISWTGRVDSLINDGVEMVAKVVIGSNGEQKMVLTPLFNSNNKTMPTVKIDMIPGND